MPLTSEGAREVILAFGGHVEAYSDVLGRTDAEMMEPYLGGEGGEEHIKRLCRSHLIQPTQEEWEALTFVALAVLELKKDRYFYSSMEGDYMMWDIHFAEKVLLGQPFTDNDWDLVRGFRVMAENEDFVEIDAGGPAGRHLNEQVIKKLSTVRNVMPEGESIFDMVLC